LVVGAPVVLQEGARARPVRILLAAVGGAVVVLTTSRTSLGLLLLAWVVVGAACVVAPRRRRALGLWLAVPALSVGLLLVGTGAAFFDRSWAGPPFLTGGTEASSQVTGSRGADSAESNGSDRVAWTQAAVHSFAEHPLTGDGFGSFLATSDPQLASGRNRSTFVHNGYAEALASGGLVFGLPVLGGAIVVGLTALRALRRRPTYSPEQPLLLGVALAAGLLLLHSGVDFDAHYASLQVLVGVLGGVLLGARGRTPSRRKASPTLVTAGLVLSLATVAVTTLAEHHGRVASRSGVSASQLLDAEWPGIRDPRIELAALAACLDASGGLAVPADVARRALSASDVAAGLLPEVRDLRARVRLALAG
jgi:hypothetical protein